MSDAQALALAHAHVWRQQHVGTHDQDREDARKWFDRFGSGRCKCPRCAKDGKKFAEREAKFSHGVRLILDEKKTDHGADGARPDESRGRDD